MGLKQYPFVEIHKGIFFVTDLLINRTDSSLY